jgi:mycothione reductase
LKVAAIIEKSKMGGTCLNRGCIPSKLLLHSADVAEMVRKSDQFGIKVEKFSIDFRKIVDRVGGIIDSDSNSIRNAFEEIDNPKLFPVEGKFVAEKTIAVGEGKTIRADRILIASGTRPAIPRIKGLEESGYITSDQALHLDEQPQVLTIIGGGYIAAELAHFFGSLGTKIKT